MRRINRAALAVTAVLSVMVITSALPACGADKCSWSLTQIEDGTGFHTPLQQSYLYDAYGNVSKYASGTQELSRPEAIKFEWEATPKTDGVTVKDYTLQISTSSDFKNPVEYRTAESYGSVYNLQIATYYYWRVQARLSNGRTSRSEVSAFTTDGTGPRNLYVDGITNVRDLGGWEREDGSRVAQGLIYRCGRLNESFNNKPDATVPVIEISADGIDAMRNVLGVKSEIDLRLVSDKEYGLIEGSPLGEDVNYYSCPMEWNISNILTDNVNRESIKKVFSVLADEDNYPVIYHCNIGTDRTGLFAFLINGLLGVSEEDLYRDYLFSNFGNIGGSRSLSGIQNSYVKSVKDSAGDALSQKAYNCLTGLGIPSEQLDAIIKIFS